MLFRVDDVGITMALFRQITSCKLQLIVQEGDLETYFSIFELACLNGKFFMFDDRFTSFTINRMVLKVFNLNTFIHTCRLCYSTLRSIVIIGGLSRAC